MAVDASHGVEDVLHKLTPEPRETLGMTMETFWTFAVFVFLCVSLYGLIAVFRGKEPKRTDQFLTFCIAIPIVIDFIRNPFDGSIYTFMVSLGITLLLFYLLKKNPHLMIPPEPRKRERCMVRGMICIVLLLILTHRTGVL